MKHAMIALVVLAGLAVGYSATASVNVNGTGADCAAAGSATVPTDGTAPSADTGSPGCTTTGLPG